jgi:hypothetical protein
MSARTIAAAAAAVALLLSATSATLAQNRQPYYGDRPYYDINSSGWLDSMYHAGIDYDVVLPNPARHHRHG